MTATNGRLEGASAVVTGGSQGIGAAIVAALLGEGARVGFLDVDDDRARQVLDDLAGKAGLSPDRLAFRHCDISSRAEVNQAVAELAETIGPADILVNNAGISAYFDAAEMGEDDWERVFAVDLKGVWLVTRAVLPAMRAAGRGSIVNIASIHARMTTRGMFPYAAAKAGVLGLTRSLALDEGPHGIRVNAVSPGYVRTQLVQEYFDQQDDPERAERDVLDVHPLGRIATPDEIARVVAFVASAEASFMTGADVPVDGGLGAKFHT